MMLQITYSDRFMKHYKKLSAQSTLLSILQLRISHALSVLAVVLEKSSSCILRIS